MIQIAFAPSFAHEFKKLEVDLQEEAHSKIILFKDPQNHKLLKTHKLHGKFSDCYSFSVNYKMRIVFQYEAKNRVIFLAIGDHDIYR